MNTKKGGEKTMNTGRQFGSALFYGILASLFFAFTFVLNRSMNLSGGSWIWSGCLRYLFSLPILWVMAAKNHGVGPVFREIRKHPGTWLLWSTVGFGLFYLPLTAASVFGESWFVAAAWQLTIAAGVLLTPLFGKKIPGKNLAWSAVILAGIFLMQTAHEGSISIRGTAAAILLILLAAFSYPLGNRKMMIHCPAEFSTTQRVFGMTVCSMPFWIVFSVIAAVRSGPPSGGQMLQSLMVAVFSGVAATVLFFEATNRVKENPRQLAVVEATQSGEVLFTLLGGLLVLHDPAPSPAGFAGIAVIIAGMIGNSLAASAKGSRAEDRKKA